jgi:4a-hydroxytetrahydrobiopterin dehydratase
MTETLAEKTCTPCRGGVPPLGRDEALRFQAQAPDWELRDEAHRIRTCGALIAVRHRTGFHAIN